MKKGFTLIELIVVISVIAILAGMVTPLVGSLTEQARIARTQADIYALKQSVVSYDATYKEFPGPAIAAAAAPAGYPAVTAISGSTTKDANGTYTVNCNTTAQMASFNTALRPFISKSITIDPWNISYRYYFSNRTAPRVGYVGGCGPTKTWTLSLANAYDGAASGDDYYDCFFKK